MPRLSIDITPQQHQTLKAIAALRGQSIKDYVLECVLGGSPALDTLDENEALEALSAFLGPRLDEARKGALSTRSAEEIRQAARAREGLGSDE